MVPGSAPPPSQEPSQGEPIDDAERSLSPPPRGDERLGPLAILRTQKSDGRALLLYSRVEHDAGEITDEHR